MAMSEAAIPPELAKNSRRLTPSFFAAPSASSLIRASTCCCFSVCGFGRYSPFDTFWVGIGEQNSSDSTSYAREHLASSSGDIHVESDTAHPPQASKRTGISDEDDHRGGKRISLPHSPPFSRLELAPRPRADGCRHAPRARYADK